MDQHAFFKDRSDAGKRLGEKLIHFSKERSVVLTILNGGVPLGVEVAKILSCPLDFVFVHKLYLPHHPEKGFGAVTLGGTLELNHQVVDQLNLSQKEIEEAVQIAHTKLKERKEHLLHDRPSLSLLFKTAIIVDDGLTSGYTMLAAIRAVKKRSPKKIFVAVPTVSDRGLDLIKNQVDEVTYLYIHPRHFPFEIKKSYVVFEKLTNEKVDIILKSV